jgi:hypothetical protein
LTPGASQVVELIFFSIEIVSSLSTFILFCIRFGPYSSPPPYSRLQSPQRNLADMTTNSPEMNIDFPNPTQDDARFAGRENDLFPL